MWLTLLARFWYVPIIVGLLAYTDWLRHEVKDARNDLAVNVAQAKQAVAERVAKNALADKADIEYHAKQETEHAAKVGALAQSLDSVVSSLRVAQSQAARGYAGSQPIRYAAAVCSDAGANSRLSDALQDAEQRFRGAIAGYQIGVAEQIVGPASRQQLDTAQLIEWAKRGQEVNNAR